MLNFDLQNHRPLREIVYEQLKMQILTGKIVPGTRMMEVELADEMGVDKAMISRILQKLEAKGYLVRTEDENDARSKNVRALPPALEIHSQGKGLSEQFFDQVTGDFSAGERELLDRLLGRMLEKGKELAAAPAPEKEVRP